MRTESLVKEVGNAKLPTEFGEFRVHAFENRIDHHTHVALVCGEVGNGEDILVRVHSQCLTGDVFHSARCDCGAQLEVAMERIAAAGRASEGTRKYLKTKKEKLGHKLSSV
jgi:3,4-dihydroxy 2-butanone 4-phosphate synthase/GTP cyclohydrolase II